MKIRILKTTVANKQFVRAGEVIEVSESDAKLLVGMQKAEAIGDEAEVAPTPEELTSETAEAVIATGKPKRARK